MKSGPFDLHTCSRPLARKHRSHHIYTIFFYHWLKLSWTVSSGFGLVIFFVFLWFEQLLGAHRGNPCCVGALPELLNLFAVFLHLSTHGSLRFNNASLSARVLKVETARSSHLKRRPEKASPLFSLYRFPLLSCDNLVIQCIILSYNM